MGIQRDERCIDPAMHRSSETNQNPFVVESLEEFLNEGDTLMAYCFDCDVEENYYFRTFQGKQFVLNRGCVEDYLGTDFTIVFGCPLLFVVTSDSQPSLDPELVNSEVGEDIVVQGVVTSVGAASLMLNIGEDHDDVEVLCNEFEVNQHQTGEVIMAKLKNVTETPFTATSMMLTPGNRLVCDESPDQYLQLGIVYTSSKHEQVDSGFKLMVGDHEVFVHNISVPKNYEYKPDAIVKVMPIFISESTDLILGCITDDIISKSYPIDVRFSPLKAVTGGVVVERVFKGVGAFVGAGNVDTNIFCRGGSKNNLEVNDELDVRTVKNPYCAFDGFLLCGIERTDLKEGAFLTAIIKSEKKDWFSCVVKDQEDQEVILRKNQIDDMEGSTKLDWKKMIDRNVNCRVFFRRDDAIFVTCRAHFMKKNFKLPKLESLKEGSEFVGVFQTTVHSWDYILVRSFNILAALPLEFVPDAFTNYKDIKAELLHCTVVEMKPENVRGECLVTMMGDGFVKVTPEPVALIVLSKDTETETCLMRGLNQGEEKYYSVHRNHLHDNVWIADVLYANLLPSNEMSATVAEFNELELMCTPDDGLEVEATKISLKESLILKKYSNQMARKDCLFYGFVNEIKPFGIFVTAKTGTKILVPKDLIPSDRFESLKLNYTVEGVIVAADSERKRYVGRVSRKKADPTSSLRSYLKCLKQVIDAGVLETFASVLKFSISGKKEDGSLKVFRGDQKGEVPVCLTPRLVSLGLQGVEGEKFKGLVIGFKNVYRTPIVCPMLKKVEGSNEAAIDLADIVFDAKEIFFAMSVSSNRLYAFVFFEEDYASDAPNIGSRLRLQVLEPSEIDSVYLAKTLSNVSSHPYVSHQLKVGSFVSAVIESVKKASVHLKLMDSSDAIMFLGHFEDNESTDVKDKFTIAQKRRGTEIKAFVIGYQLSTLGNTIVVLRMSKTVDVAKPELPKDWNLEGDSSSSDKSNPDEVNKITPEISHLATQKFVDGYVEECKDRTVYFRLSPYTIAEVPYHNVTKNLNDLNSLEKPLFAPGTYLKMKNEVRQVKKRKYMDLKMVNHFGDLKKGNQILLFRNQDVSSSVLWPGDAQFFCGLSNRSNENEMKRQKNMLSKVKLNSYFWGYVVEVLHDCKTIYYYMNKLPKYRNMQTSANELTAEAQKLASMSVKTSISSQDAPSVDISVLNPDEAAKNTTEKVKSKAKKPKLSKNDVKPKQESLDENPKRKLPSDCEMIVKKPKVGQPDYLDVDWSEDEEFSSNQTSETVYSKVLETRNFHDISEEPEPEIVELSEPVESSAKKPKKRLAKGVIDKLEIAVKVDPDSHKDWITYMEYYIELGDLVNVREICRRAVDAIDDLKYDSKLQVWTRLLDAEVTLGTSESVSETFTTARQRNNPLLVHLRMAEIWEKYNNFDKAVETYKLAIKNFKTRKEPWLKYMEFLFRNKKFKEGTDLMTNSFASLTKQEHLELVTKKAQLEFEFGEVERGKTNLENVLSTYPKRTDIWYLYMDLLASIKDNSAVRSVFARVLSLNFRPYKLKPLYKSYLLFEKTCGSIERYEEAMEDFKNRFGNPDSRSEVDSAR